MVDRELIEKDLDAFVEGDTWPIPNEDGTPKTPGDERAAQGILRRIKALQRERETIVDVAKGEIARMTEWRDDRVRGIDSEIEYGDRSLEAFARTRPARARATKMVPLPDGNLTLTKTVYSVVITDEPAYLLWASGVPLEDVWVGDLVEKSKRTEQEHAAFIFAVRQALQERVRGVLAHADYLRVSVEVDKTALKAVVDKGAEFEDDGVKHRSLATPEGEEIPGARLERPAPDRFGVTLASD